jgi:hypothetical protein
MTAAELDIIVGANVDDAIAAFKKLGYTVKQTEQSVTKSGQKSAQAFTDFNRVIQDAPFGFIAIQNNIGPLIDSFKIMREEAKSAGVSLGSVLKNALSGPAGLGLAISAVTAAITFLQVGFTSWFRSSKESEKAANEFAEALKNISAEAEAAKNNMASFATSLDAMQQLWAAQNKVRFFGADQEANLLDAKNKVAFVIAEYNKLGHAVDDAIQNSYKALNVFSNAVAAHGEGSAQATEAEKEYNKILQIQYDLEKQREEKGNELANVRSGQALAQLQYDKELSDAAKKRAEEEKKAAEKRIKDYNDSYKALIKFFDATKQHFRPGQPIAPYEAIQITGAAFKLSDLEAEAAMINMRETLKKAGAKVFNAQGILSDVDIINESELKSNIQRITPIVKSELDLINGLIKDGLIQLGEAIGNAFSGKQNIFSSFLQFLGSSLVKLGEYVISSVTLLTEIRIALIEALKGTPFLGIAVGVGLIALGTILKNIPQFATGGVVTKPTLALVGEQGPERITPLGYEGAANNGWMGGEVVFQISGQNLRGILRRADQTAFNTF